MTTSIQRIMRSDSIFAVIKENTLLLHPELKEGVEKISDSHGTFYYDETNNVRKLLLRQGKFNNSIDGDFVLGGIFVPSSSSMNPNHLRTIARINASVKEVKCRTLCSNPDFWECIKNEKVGTFLKWIYESDWLVHYSAINYFYFALVDIIDSINLSMNHLGYINGLKNELYRIAKENFNSMYNLLYSYNFPNIAKGLIPRFCDELISIVLQSSGQNIWSYHLVKELMGTKEHNTLIFLEGNPEKTIIKKFVNFYIDRIALFDTSKHVFDEELSVQDQLKEIQQCENTTTHTNYVFKKSDKDLYIQVSDCWVGLMGKFSRYVNTTADADISAMWANLKEEQRKNFSMYAKIIKRSDDLSPCLSCSIKSSLQRDFESDLLSIGCAYKSSSK